ncbi:uncharacterized protein [Lepeophtheirus salmonis]|uniref:uncharacterized protein n=1 Tax=Lepeophtheirus salmonis TaxID=72036 RepID=UPI001AE2F2D3|nr:(DL)-glycerol-3-phosphatase 2-like [Lepeophtheirus salmonis]
MGKVVLASPDTVPNKNDWVDKYLVIPELSHSEDPFPLVEKVYESEKDVDLTQEDIIYFVASFCGTKDKESEWDVQMKRPMQNFYDRQLLNDLSESSLKSLPYKKIKYVVFDVDGLLLDTENIYTLAQQEILNPFGVKFTNEAKCLMMGQKPLDGANTLIEHYNLENKLDPKDFLKQRYELCDKLFPDCKLLPGVEKLLKHLKSHSIPAAVATGSEAQHFKLKTQSHSKLFEDSFRHIITSDLVKKSKPHPEIFLLAASRFKGYSTEENDQVLVFEDSPLGIQAASAAGFHSVLIETEYNLDSKIKSTQRLPSLCEFKPELWGLPPYE